MDNRGEEDGQHAASAACPVSLADLAGAEGRADARWPGLPRLRPTAGVGGLLVPSPVVSRGVQTHARRPCRGQVAHVSDGDRDTAAYKCALYHWIHLGTLAPCRLLRLALGCGYLE